ncbi:MAG: anhydro-N-acetylmuramic acid kinase [Woeseiaceae bacterium]
MQSQRLFIGLISGTSADGIDSALVSQTGDRFSVEHALTTPYPDHLQQALLNALADPSTLNVTALGKLDVMIGNAFAGAALQLLASANVDASAISAIGSHGQTVFHEPDTEHPFTLQVGDSTRIAHQTGIPTISDFRSADIATGGQGAPLAPLLHEHWFGHLGDHVGVLNLGGIANLTVLTNGRAEAGFDTGPANGLMNIWATLTDNGAFDEDGNLAAMAPPDHSMLTAMLSDDFFARPAPKSTGREHFNAQWLLDRTGFAPDQLTALPDATVATVMSTLCQLTVNTISDAMSAQGMPELLILCGGGVHNRELRRRLMAALPAVSVKSSDDFGCDPDYIEAALFAWMASRRLDAQPVNTTRFTGARQPLVAGNICLPPGALSR